MTYPSWQELADAGHTPDYLDIGAAAMYALNGTRPPVSRVMSQPADKETLRLRFERHSRAQGVTPRLFKSRFVGVTVNNGLWVGLVDATGKKQGPRRPRTDEGEVAAAWDRAFALARPGIEERSLEHVAPREPSAPLEPRGHAKKRLGGKRVA